MTAVSAATYALVHDRYRMMDPGASMGKGYGPILVAREPMKVGATCPTRSSPSPAATPPPPCCCGSTSGDPPIIEVAFDKIPRAVLEGQADVGLLIHEGQITHAQMGLHKVLDLGARWEQDTALPLPLGINVMRRDLGEDVHRRLSQALRDSIDYAYAHVDEALEYAMRYGRGHRQGDVPPLRADVRQRLHHAPRARRPRRPASACSRLAHDRGLIPDRRPDPIDRRLCTSVRTGRRASRPPLR